MVGQKTVVLVDMCLDADDMTHRRRARSVWGPAKKMIATHAKVEPVFFVRFRFPDWLTSYSHHGAYWRRAPGGIPEQRHGSMGAEDGRAVSNKDNSRD